MVALRIPAAAPDARKRFPCSQAQKRFWFEEQLHPANPGLNVAVRWRLDGAVSSNELNEAWRHIIARHQVLRTCFEVDNGEPIQVVSPEMPFAVSVVDLSDFDEQEALKKADALAEIEAHKPFDLAVPPLIRVTQVKVSERVSILMLTAHHTVCDGWSIGILAKEMGEFCAARQAGRPADLPTLPISYAEYAAAEREWLSQDPLEAEAEYSKRVLQGYKQFEFPADHPRPPVQTSSGNIASMLIDRELTDALAAIARDNGCTLFMTSFAALLALLHRYTGEEDIALGTQVVGRDEIDVEDLVGCFINTVALRCDISDDPTFVQLLERVREAVLETFEMRRFPLERLIEIVNPKRDLSRNALFSTNFIFQRSFVRNGTYGSFSLVDLPSRSAGALYDLNFFMVERPEGWRASCEYNSDLFYPETVATALAHFVNILRAVAADPTKRISELPILDDEERRQLVVGRNQTEAAYPAETVVQLFERRAALQKDAVAVVCGAETLTYGQLDAAADRLAGDLTRRGFGPRKRIGVLLNRSTDLLTALLAVMKCGSAYVPLDPAYPIERIAYIAGDAGLACLITTASLRDRLPRTDLPAMLLDAPDGGAPSQGVSARTEPAGAEDVAYVIYTSGSTGNPKGVVIPHRALTNLLWAMGGRPGMHATDTLVAVTTICFDIAALEFFLPLVTGARLVIAKEQETSDGRALIELLRSSGATVMQATPATWQMLVEAGWKGAHPLRMLCGGEALSRTLATALLQRGDELWNMYGPTETTIWSSALRVEDGEGPVPVGAPLANTQFYVLDGHRQLVPSGAAGELFIGGDGVALGYVDLPALTDERFVPDPFRNVAGAKLYRTGDIVRARRDGSLEFRGRADHQIKLRGFRIELGEIETVLQEQPDIADAVVVLGQDPSGDKALRAFVVAKHAATRARKEWTDDVRTRLARALPAYMVPPRIAVLDAFPRTPNGKVDRRALEAPSMAGGVAPDSRLPSTPTEVRLAAVLAELLKLERIGVDDDIFALGFHSLLAVRLLGKIEESLSVKLPLRTLFDHPTVAALAADIDRPSADARVPVTLEPIVAMNTGGWRTPFIFLHSDLFADGLYCRRLAAEFGPTLPLYAVAPHGTAGLELLPTIEAMAKDYLARIRRAVPNGPYRLGGFCSSGLVAYELARLLRAEGEIVDDLILINASGLPTRAIQPFDWLVRQVGLNDRLEPRVRESVCYNLARLHGALARGPGSVFRLLRARVKSLMTRRGTPRARIDDPEPFERRRGAIETENSFAHLVAALTYHPKPYDGDVTLIWGIEQRPTPGDPIGEWKKLARSVRVAPIGGGHVAALHERIEELAVELRVLLER